MIHQQWQEQGGADPQHLNADPDPAFDLNSDPVPAFHFNEDPDPSYYIQVMEICDP